MARTLEARIAGGIHVQQIAGAGPLIAADGLTPLSRPVGKPVTVKHLPHRGVRKPGLTCHQTWPPATPPPPCADPLLSLSTQQPERAMRPTRPVRRPRQRTVALLAKLLHSDATTDGQSPATRSGRPPPA